MKAVVGMVMLGVTPEGTVVCHEGYVGAPVVVNCAETGDAGVAISRIVAKELAKLLSHLFLCLC
jgi:hypothetical protein